MKLIVILIFAFSINLSASVLAQKITLTAEGESLQSVLQELRRQSGYALIYKGQDLANANRVTIAVHDQDLSEVLRRIFANQPLIYTIEERVISVIPKPLNSTPPNSAHQQRTIEGTVRDTTGAPLPGVSVLVKGIGSGTSTGPDGTFVLHEVQDDAVLVFSYVGFLSQEVMIGGRSIVDITLKQDVAALDEVVVIGYGTQKKSDLTGAVSSVSSDVLEKEVAGSFDQLLQGKVPGVQVVVGTGAPGGGTSINIRGSGSLQASNEPLYVIDGVPIDNLTSLRAQGNSPFPQERSGPNPLSALNPADIESIDILKDASAAAIYGSRGANGVIIVTTKSGQSGKLRVNYNGYFGTQSLPNRLDVLSPQEYMRVLNELVDAGGGLESERVHELQNGGTEWQDEIYRTAPVQSHNLSFAGGGDATTFYASLNNFGQDGVVDGSSFERWSGRFNLTHQLQNRFKLGMNLTTSYTKDDYAPVGDDPPGAVHAANEFDPSLAPTDADGNYSRSSLMPNADNPLALIHGSNSLRNTWRILGSVYGEYFVLPELSVKLNLGADALSERRDIYAGRETVLGESNNGQASIIEGHSSNYLIEGTVNYNKTFGNHAFSAVAGITTQKFVVDQFEAIGSGFASDATQSYNMGLADVSQFLVESEKIESRLLSYLGRINYALYDKYLLTLSFRVDGSSKFGTNNKFGYFPSAAFAWKVHEEPFFASLSKTFSSLKVRTSWGRNGNQDIGNYASLPTFTGASPLPWDDEWASTAIPSRIANPDLKWETSEQVNIGLDLGLFDDRIGATVDYFRKTTSDLLMEMPIPQSSGFSEQLRNVGSIFNTGIEFGAYAQILTGNFTWRANLSLSTLRNEVLDLGGVPMIVDSGSGSPLLREGDPMNSFFGYEIDGIWQADDDFSATIDNVHPGAIKFRDQNGDGTVNAGDRVILGNSFADLMGSVGNTFGYKGFELYVYFDFQQGVSMYNASLERSLFPTSFRMNRMAELMLNRWTPENPNNRYPSFVDPLAQRDKAVNSLTVDDGAYLRLQTVRLSYQFNLDTRIFRSASVYVMGQNLLTMTDYKGISPVVNARGDANFRVDLNQYPLARTFLAGVNLQF